MPRNLVKLPFLETMITQVCNLSCQGCTNYSDLHHSGYVTWALGKKSLESWLQILVIDDFGIMGGEPLINPEWRQWILGVRDLMPDAQIRFTTNGLFLHRATDILDIMDQVGNIVFKITVHVHSTELEACIQQILDDRKWEPVIEHGIHRYRSSNDVKLQINRPHKFLKTFRGEYHDMMPYQSDPEKAFAVCCQQTCPLLLGDRIFKCSTSGLLKDTLARFNNPNLDQWRPYLSNGISIQDSKKEIQSFVANFGSPSAICGQCPDSTAAKLPHLATVKFKSNAATA